jgi:hypothetical protein
VLGAHYDDLLNIKNNWMKNIVASGIFWILFIAVEKEYLARRDSRQKPSGRWREACFSFLIL